MTHNHSDREPSCLYFPFGERCLYRPLQAFLQTSTWGLPVLAVLTSVKILTESVLQTENKRAWARSYSMSRDTRHQHARAFCDGFNE